MNTLTTKLIAAGLLFTFTLLSGLWLSHSGKPYNSGIFAIHKLIALATIMIIGISVFNLYKAVDLQTLVEIAVIATSGLLFLALVVTGSLLSLNISLSGIALKVHQLVPLLALVASTITISLLIRANS
jgi:hypothetical protein